MPELLLELLSEEIPARMQDRAAAELAELLAGSLGEAGLAFATPVRQFATPRRLVVVVRELAVRQADRMVERKGPRVDAPEAARAGFLRSLEGMAYRLEEREDRKARVVFALIEEQGRSTAELLAERLPDLLARLPWPKSMRWGEGDARWVRPLESILCLYDGAVVPFAFAGIASGAMTRGHRFMAPAAFAVRDFGDYAARLRQGRVMLDGEERRRVIEERATELAASAGLRLRPDGRLLDELKGLVEWPVPLLGSIDPGFMDLPPEVLVTTMREHQRYLALETSEGTLAPKFVVVANIEADDGGAAIVAGNERVLRARLWDARFFWDQDRARPLESLLPKLAGTIFHAELGSQGERVERLTALAVRLVSFLPRIEAGSVERAARLAKADLASGLVGEFPELQGIVGGHIARAQGEAPEVAAAIAGHYAPRGADDDVPTAPVSIAVALADRLDTLVGFFGKGIRPTGSKDPFALRRAALGVIRIVLEGSLRMPLRTVLRAAHVGYGDPLAQVDGEALADELLAFFADRLQVHLRGEGVRHDLIAAVFAARAGRNDDLALLRLRAQALQAFLETDDGRNLLAGYRRAANIVAIEEKKDARSYDGAPDERLLAEPAERELFTALEIADKDINAGIAGENYAAAMKALAALRAPIDRFFDHVMVNAPEPELRANRLCLLKRIRTALDAIADFSKIEDVRREAR